MYTFVVTYYDIETDSYDDETITVDSTCYPCTECEIFAAAMVKAYNYCMRKHVEFSSLEFLSC